MHAKHRVHTGSTTARSLSRPPLPQMMAPRRRRPGSCRRDRRGRAGTSLERPVRRFRASGRGPPARIPAAGLAVEHPEEHDVDDQAAARGENHRRTIHLGWRTHSFNRLDHDYERRAPNHRDDPQRSEDFEPREAERQPAGVVIAARHSSLGRRTRRFESPVSSLLPERQFQDADGEGVGHKVRRHVQRVGEQRGGSGDGCKQNTTSF